MAATVSVLIIRASKRKNRNQQAPVPTGITVRPPLLSNAQTFYAPTLVADNTLLVPLLTNVQVFYGPTVSREEALILPLLTNSQTFYGPGVKQNVSVPLLSNDQTFYGPQVSADDRLTFPLLTNSQTFFAPSINQHVIVPLLTNSQTFYGVAVLRDMALDVPLLTNTQSFYQPAIKQNISLPRINSTTGFFPISVSQPSQPGLALSTPGVVVTSAAGALPEIDLTINPDHYAGYYLDIQRSTTGTKNVTDGSYVTQTLNISHQIRPQEVAALAITSLDLAPDGYIDPSGVYFQQYRIRREDGALSRWVEISGNVTASVATLSTVNGVNKHQYAIVNTATPLHFRGTAGTGAVVRATHGSVDGIFQFEITVTVVAGTLFFGLDDGTSNFNSGVPRPGLTTSTGLCFEVQATNWINAYWSTASQQRTFQSSGISIAVGDVFHVSINQTTGVCQLKRKRGATIDTFASFTANIGAAKLEYAWVGTTSNCEGDVNFGASAFVMDDGSGIYA